MTAKRLKGAMAGPSVNKLALRLILAKEPDCRGGARVQPCNGNQKALASGINTTGYK
jgi:hypothetical protein